MHHSSRRRVIDVLNAISRNCKVEELGYNAARNAERRIRNPQEYKKIFMGSSRSLPTHILRSKNITNKNKWLIIVE